MLSVQERLNLNTESVEGHAWQWACMLRCATVGKVVSFDSVKQTCVVQPVTQELIVKPPPSSSAAPSPGSSQNIITSETIAPIQDVPIFMQRVPGWSITLPITEGTECLLIHPDTCIDGWWSTGAISAQYDRRRHDLSDAIAFFGPWSQPYVLNNYSTNSMQIRSDDQTVVIDLSNSKIKITAPEVDVQAMGGTADFVMTHAFYTYWTTVVYPFLLSKGFSGGVPPANSITTVLKGE